MDRVARCSRRERAWLESINQRIQARVRGRKRYLVYTWRAIGCRRRGLLRIPEFPEKGEDRGQALSVVVMAVGKDNVGDVRL